MQSAYNLFIICAPSGTGKSSLVRALLQSNSDLRLSISHTTRAPRGQEVNGREYHFVDDTVFDAMLAHDAFLEWANVHDKRYGTNKDALLTQLQNHDVILEIDYQGAFQIQKLFPQATLIFVLPPSLEELRQRIEKRGEDTPERIHLRMENAKLEIKQAPLFEYLIINTIFENALADVQSIIRSRGLSYQAQCTKQHSIFTALGISSH